MRVCCGSAQDHTPRGGQEQRGQHALGARAARRGLRVPGAPRLRRASRAFRGSGSSRRPAAPAAHEPQRDHGPVRRHRGAAPAARAARRVARERRAEDRLSPLGGAAGRLRPLPGRALVRGRGHLARLLPSTRAWSCAWGTWTRGSTTTSSTRVVHSSSEKACVSSTSKVCLWWSEFDLDDEEYSCRPKRDASNIVTPVHPAGHARREQGGLPAALAAAALAALVAARALAAAGRHPLRALGRPVDQGVTRSPRST